MKKGFTLIELLIVIAIIAILAAAVIIAIAPGERMLAARESTRASHMASIGTAIHLAVVENPEFSSVFEVMECVDDGIKADEEPVPFTDECESWEIMPSIPEDPVGGEYRVAVDTSDASGKVTVYPSEDATESEWHEDGEEGPRTY